MRLYEFIEQHRDEIVAEWSKFAATLVPWATGLTERELRDHSQELLTAVIRDMKSPQSRFEQLEKSMGHAEAGELGAVGHSHAIERLATGQNLSELVSEYRALRATVHRLWEEARDEDQNEITRFNEAIDETLSEATAKHSQIVDLTREQFLAILGHDLRNPLAAITAGASVLTRSTKLGEREIAIAAKILNSAARISRMVSDLLDLTRTRLGSGISVERQPSELRTVLDGVLSEFDISHPERELRFEARGDLHGEWDGDRLSQVLSNLLANAFDYGAQGQPVTVVAQDVGDEVVLQVHNAGEQIPEAALRTMFQPMVRHTPSSEMPSRNPEGLGLGLFIVKEVVTAHDGSISVASTAEGTTFTVRLPKHTLPRRRQQLNETVHA